MTPRRPDKKVYFNRPQMMAQFIAANTTVVCAGRRTGKTDSIAAPYVLKMVQRMPGSTGGIVVPTFKHGLTNTLPGLFAAWKRWGYENGLHYVVGCKPPKHFRKPIIEPANFEHVISFYNGSVAVIISQDRAGSSNGLTLSWLLVDEAKFIDYLQLKEETLPANGGIKSHFGRHSFNHALMILSDMPQTQRGSWFLHYREKMDPTLIRTIEGTLHEIWRQKQLARELMKQPNPDARDIERLKSRIRCLDRDLNKMRSVAVYYREYSSIENLQLLGENYIKQMKRDLTPLTFQTSILCQRIGITKDGFYSSMREAHKYNASDLAYLDSLGYDGCFDGGQLRIDSMADADVNPDAPICIGMDYGANINWIVGGQPRDNKLLVIKSFFVKFERKIPALVEDFCNYYSTHRNKTVIYYWDATAKNSNYAVNDTDFHQVVVREFERRGWTVIDIYLGMPMRHEEKHLLINMAFQGKQRLMPMFNRQNNDDLILAVQTAGVTRGSKGFRKYKAGEKLAETEENLMEHRTDGTDAFDTLYIGCEKYPQYGALVPVFTGGLM